MRKMVFTLDVRRFRSDHDANSSHPSLTPFSEEPPVRGFYHTLSPEYGRGLSHGR